LRASIAASAVPFDGQAIAVTTSIGMASLTDTDSTIDAVLARADAALYRAKHAGRNCVVAG